MKGIQPRTREEYLNKFYEFDNMVKVYNAYLLQQRGQIHKLARSYSNDLRSQLYRSHRIGINRFEKEIGNGIIEVGQQLQHVGDNVSMESLRALRKMTSVRRGLGNRESFGRITDLFFKLPLGVKTVLTSKGIGPKIKWQSADNNTLLGQVWQEYFLRSLKLGDTSAIDEYLRATGREFEASYLKVALQRIPPPPTSGVDTITTRLWNRLLRLDSQVKSIVDDLESEFKSYINGVTGPKTLKEGGPTYDAISKQFNDVLPWDTTRIEVDNPEIFAKYVDASMGPEFTEGAEAIFKTPKIKFTDDDASTYLSAVDNNLSLVETTREALRELEPVYRRIAIPLPRK